MLVNAKNMLSIRCCNALRSFFPSSSSDGTSLSSDSTPIIDSRAIFIRSPLDKWTPKKPLSFRRTTNLSFPIRLSPTRKDPRDNEYTSERSRKESKSRSIDT